MAQGDHGCLLRIALFLLLTGHHSGGGLPCYYCSALTAVGRPLLSSSQKLFVRDFTDWLTKEEVVYQSVTLVDEHHTTSNRKNSDHYWYAAPHVWLVGDPEKGLAVHLLPSPTELEDTVPPALSQQLTDACRAGLLFATPSSNLQIINNNEPLRRQRQQQVSGMIHIHQDVWYGKQDICQCRLLARLGRVQSRIFARKTAAQRIDRPTALAFLQEHHLWGGIQSKYNYGLFYNDDPYKNNTTEAEEQPVLVAVATFSPRRKVLRGGVPHRSHELVRFCARRDGTVVGGITKLIKAFARDHTPDDIVTVVDRDWGPGNGWNGIGFETVAVMPPLVMAIQKKDGLRRYLVGAGLSTDSSSKNARLGLEAPLLDQLDSIREGGHQRAVECLAEKGYHLVHDTGVERLLLVIKPSADGGEPISTTQLWKDSVPTYASQYYSNNSGIASLLCRAEIEPMDALSELADVASWRSTSGEPKRLLFSEKSSLDPNARVQVEERPHRWRTVSLTGGQVKNIFHGVYKIIDQALPDNGNGKHPVDASANIVEYIQAMAAATLIAISGSNTSVNPAEAGKHNLRFLHHGLGAGTLPRLLRHCLGDNPSSEHVIVELDQAVVNAESLHAVTDRNTQIHTGDALKFTEATPCSFDAILVDIFDANNRLPSEFYSSDYLQRLHDEVLTQNGFVVHNFHTNENIANLGEQLVEATQAYTSVFESCFLIDSVDSSPNGGNTILLATKQPFTSSLALEGLKARAQFGLAFDVSSRVKNARIIK